MSDIGDRMSILEAARLLEGLCADTSTRTFAALAGWEYPMSREAMALADLYDAFVKVNYKKPKPYPRPWSETKTERLGQKTPLTQAEVLDALRSAGHHLPVPEHAA